MRKAIHPVQKPRWYASREVALILQTDEWRIRNFGSKAYGLEAQIKSPGSGNRKRYFFEVVLKLAVADELYSAHLNPVGIKAALDLIGKEKLIEQWIASFVATEKNTNRVLALALSERGSREKNEWERVWKAHHSNVPEPDVENFFERGSPVLSLHLAQLWESVVRRISELEAEGKI